MGTRVIGGLCDLFIYRFDLISMHVPLTRPYITFHVVNSRVQGESGDLRSPERRQVHHYGGLGPLP
jgi:hypothetical protein